ncbi:acetyl-CoA carboxylase [Paracoccus fistulariae]|uniref:Biotin carboxyl carrier protein of acetyl-CoA carboxylase n=1 Tax=Paracoccus fistulariae TaxID=658446 RepID=A0ABY7SNF3_9RHOB|nr:acetyl-CoA carboxylase [Paracoccus fistulariae]MDB6180443.1 acetyl-CoA carboxylase [Paracoccus fistulariae]WCR08521.1 biotin carboxyl carrier domain-containing protein [Paracoccus fistulariae]
MAKAEIRSPLPGVFYRKPAPDQPNYKEVGDTVAAGDVIGLVEVMKSFTEVTADQAGTITAFLVEDEDAIMPGQPLAELEI